METVELDERGRLTVPKDLRDQMGAKKFRIVIAGHMLLLHPVVKDPVKHWQEVWKGVKFKSLAEERRETEEAMKREILREKNVRRH